MNLLNHLVEQQLITPPAWLPANTMYLTIMGSTAYGVADTNEDQQSDLDLYGFCIPPKEVVFPHLAGEVWGFGRFKEGIPKSWFAQYQQHHVHDPSARAGKGREYDLQIYNIVKYVQLCVECKHYWQAVKATQAVARQRLVARTGSGYLASTAPKSRLSARPGGDARTAGSQAAG
jgi:hypothetical protein